MEKTLKINLGCGADYKDGWINIDKDPKCLADIREDIETFTEFNQYDNSVDEILLSHVAMYIRPEEMQVLLKKWYGWLKEGGKLTIETIDLTKVMQIVVDPFSDKRESWGLFNIFGPSNAQHRWGWTYEHLLKLIDEAGFKNSITYPGLKKPNRDYQLIATK